MRRLWVGTRLLNAILVAPIARAIITGLSVAIELSAGSSPRSFWPPCS
jgi:hypothetical protein